MIVAGKGAPVGPKSLEKTEAESPVMHEKTSVGVAIGLAMNCNDGLVWEVRTTHDEEGGEARGCLNVLGNVGLDTYFSARTAYRFVKQFLLQKQPANTFFANSNLALNLPTGDGPSAGCTIATSLLSFAMKKTVRKDLAMTGIINSTGRVLPVSGVKEKTIGARRNHIKMIIFPEANRKDFDELSENLKEGLDVHFVDEYVQIFELAFQLGSDRPTQTTGSSQNLDSSICLTLPYRAMSHIAAGLSLGYAPAQALPHIITPYTNQTFTPLPMHIFPFPDQTFSPLPMNPYSFLNQTFAPLPIITIPFPNQTFTPLPMHIFPFPNQTFSPLSMNPYSFLNQTFAPLPVITIPFPNQTFPVLQVPALPVQTTSPTPLVQTTSSQVRVSFNKITIGNWTQSGDLVAICNFRKKLLVWEVLDNVKRDSITRKMYKRIKMTWSSVLSLRASNGILEIELSAPPMFSIQNDDPLAKKGWKRIKCFTRDHSTSFCRRHQLHFAPEGLEEFQKTINAHKFGSKLPPYPSLQDSFYFRHDGENLSVPHQNASLKRKDREE